MADLLGSLAAHSEHNRLCMKPIASHYCIALLLQEQAHCWCLREGRGFRAWRWKATQLPRNFCVFFPWSIFQRIILLSRNYAVLFYVCPAQFDFCWGARTAGSGADCEWHLAADLALCCWPNFPCMMCCWLGKAGCCTGDQETTEAHFTNLQGWRIPSTALMYKVQRYGKWKSIQITSH